MESKLCIKSNIENCIEDFFNKYTERKNCPSMRSLKRYYDKKNEISNQRYIYYEKNEDNLLQKQNGRLLHSKEYVRPYVEMDKRLKALEEMLSINDHQIFYK